MKDVECPYCGLEQDVDHEDCSLYREDQLFTHECEACEKTFVYSISVHISFESAKAPCLNGEDHNWERTRTFPEEFAVMRCNYCGEEKPLGGES